MKEFQYTVKDACGIHARPAGLLVKVAKGFASTATLEKDGKSCDLRKLMALMGMGVKQGDTVTITATPDKGYELEMLKVLDRSGDALKLTEKNGKYTFKMPASAVIVKATFMEDNSMLNFFYDVPNNAYFYEAVKWAVKNGITDGSCGMRSLIDWIMSTEITGDPYSSALYTIVSKATSDEEDRDALKATVLEPIFAPKRKKAV